MAPKANRSTPSSTLLSTTPTKKPVASSNPDPKLKLVFTHRGARLSSNSRTPLSTQYGLSSNHSAATTYLRAAQIVGPISIEHLEQRSLGAWITLPRRLCEVLVPNVVLLLLYTSTTSVPPNPPRARGWQRIPAPV